jgi:ribosomal protein L37AE/L43A
MSGENKLQCPNCKKYNIQNSRSNAAIFLVVGLVTAIILVGFFFIIAGIIGLMKKPQYTCKDCGYKWIKGEKATITS